MRPSIFLRHSSRCLLLALLMASVITPAQAAMSLSRTRLIVTAKEREATIDSRNEGQSPILLQTWVDAETDPEASRPNSEAPPVPFITDPPMFRIDPDSSRQIRVLLVQPPANLPTTQESLFWFNAYETPARPPTSGSDNENYIQFAFHVRIKLFYRPAALADYSLTDAHKLRFTLKQNDAGKPVLHIHNPAPIHQSISTLALAHNDERIEFENVPMLAPNSALQLLLPAPPPATSGMRVVYATINDHGSLVEAEQAI